MKTDIEKIKESFANILPETKEAIRVYRNAFANDFSHEELATLAAMLLVIVDATGLLDDDESEEAVDVHELSN